MKITEHNNTVLNPKWEECGFMVGKYEDPLCYANMKTHCVVPLLGSNTKLVIIHGGKQLKTCRNRKSAVNFIERHKRCAS